MGAETKRTEIPQNIDFEVIGSGTIGLKAEQLLQKTAKLREIGFKTPKRTSLAQGFLEDIDVNVLQRVIDGYHHSPLAIRSSAAGDARGTGVYESVFVERNLQSVLEGINRVMESYDSPAAVAFRSDAKTGEGMGILIEPMIGQEIDDKFLPVLSGYGYTSTSRGEGYIGVVPGFGGGVQTGLEEKLWPSLMKRHNNNLKEYVYSQFLRLGFGHTVLRPSALMGVDKNLNFMRSRGYREVMAYLRPKAHSHFGGEVYGTGADFGDRLENVIDSFDLSKIFSIMEKMEAAFSKPQYFEWAMTAVGKTPLLWILQIADVDKKLDWMEFGDFGKIVFVGHSVSGSGIKKINKAIYCLNPTEIEALRKFNQENKNYLLLFSASLTSRAGGYEKLNYSDYSNASVFLEVQNVAHKGTPASHLSTKLSESGKFVAAISDEAQVRPSFGLLLKHGKGDLGVKVYEGKLKVIASERQDKLVVYLQKD